MIEPEWLNTPDIYNQYCFEADPRLVSIIQRWGFAFDEKYWYWIPTTRKGKPTQIVKRAPLWTYPRKAHDNEKHAHGRKFTRGRQTKLHIPKLLLVKSSENEKQC
jgi:hypothetical protein